MVYDILWGHLRLNSFCFNVKYWPSTKLLIKRFTSVNNRCIRWKISGYHLDLWTWLNSVQMPTENRWTPNNYITRCHRRLELVGVRLQFSSSRSCPRSENQLQREGLGPQDPGWAAQQNEEEVLLKSEELGVNIWQSVPSPTHL